MRFSCGSLGCSNPIRDRPRKIVKRDIKNSTVNRSATGVNLTGTKRRS